MTIDADERLIPFWDAVHLVLTDTAMAAFAFKPERRGGDIVGGTVYTICRSDDDEDESENAWRVFVDGGDFHDEVGTDDVIFPENADGDECATLLYQLCPARRASDVAGLGYKTEYILSRLHGYEEDPANIEGTPTWRVWLTQHDPEKA